MTTTMEALSPQQQAFLELLHSNFNAQLDEMLHKINELDEATKAARDQLDKYLLSKNAKKNKYFQDAPEKSFLRQGGTDPLEVIYTFKNDGDASRGIPRHWHYVGLGLSDIYGYAERRRLHDRMRILDPAYAQATQPSADIYPPLHPDPSVKMNGFEFELTFRLKCSSDQEWFEKPPGWPRQLLQNLAWYVFKSKVKINRGDHIGWHSPLDGGNDYSTSIKHILVTSDPQLQETETCMGPIAFLQIVGVCQEEFEGARECSSKVVLDLMRNREDTGGRYLVTNMRRQKSIFHLEPQSQAKLRNEVKKVGSNMKLMSNKLKLSHTKPLWFIRAEELQRRQIDLLETNGGEEKPILEHTKESETLKSIIMMDEVDENDAKQDYPARAQSRLSAYMGSALGPSNEPNSIGAEFYDSTYILIGLESARYLSIMLSGILSNGKDFSFVSMNGQSTITFIPEYLEHKLYFVGQDKPFGRRAHWHQVYVVEELREQMYLTIGKDFSSSVVELDVLTLPRNYSWTKFNLFITVVDEIP